MTESSSARAAGITESKPSTTNLLRSSNAVPLETFPPLDDQEGCSPTTGATPDSHGQEDVARDRGISSSSTLQSRIRSASKKFEESNPPAGFMLASAQIGSSIPSISDIRRGSYGCDGWSAEGQVVEKERRASLVRRGSSQADGELLKGKDSPAVTPSPRSVGPTGGELRHQSLQETADEHIPLNVIKSGVAATAVDHPTYGERETSFPTDEQNSTRSTGRRNSNETRIIPATSVPKAEAEYRTTPFDNGYQFPPKRKWTQSTVIFLKAFWKFFITPVGFLVTVYGLNVVAWGGMLFLLLCNASPAMCHPTCNDINSPRRIWIEIDSQILNALFCVTGFGTIPWRFRDLYYLLQYRLQKKQIGLRRLAGINRSWFRLEGSQKLPAEYGPAEAQFAATEGCISEDCLPFPLARTPNAPLTGARAPPTDMWKLDFVVWTMVWNTFLQAVLSGFMWGMNRYKRPSWSTGLFVALACIVAACGGFMSFVEGKKVKSIEGVPLTESDKAILERDRELGISHYNNINDEKPKEKKAHKKTSRSLFKGKHTKTEKRAG
ncbi:hypothetical protein BP5796_04656 [Coleophoma crateriformis]|uniref:Alpha-L-rhamnosidase C-terminal domain-containing protein n=1 Tax=Coleophoma crateriformis TaxID=565419 RepID=A0A3D8SA02_9HELO|nr:hypothetical protein BP5796_04656 [Coleophoma crateriformis]